MPIPVALHGTLTVYERVVLLAPDEMAQPRWPGRWRMAVPVFVIAHPAGRYSSMV